MAFLGIAAVFAIIDLTIKYLIDKAQEDKFPKRFCKGKLEISRVYNEGLAFGILKSKPNIVKRIVGISFLLTNIVCIYSFFSKVNSAEKFGFAMLLGGAFGNFHDKVAKGKTTDYIKFNRPRRKKSSKTVFNAADFFLVLGALIALIGSLFNRK